MARENYNNPTLFEQIEPIQYSKGGHVKFNFQILSSDRSILQICKWASIVTSQILILNLDSIRLIIGLREYYYHKYIFDFRSYFHPNHGRESCSVLFSFCSVFDWKYRPGCISVM